VCFINGDISRQISGIHAQASITFIVIDEPEVLESEPIQFLSHDLYFFGCFWQWYGGNISQQQNMINNEVGVIYQNSDWDFARYSKQYRAVIHRKMYAYRQFLFRRKGKYRPFWLPTYEANMRCKSTGFISSVMLIESDQYKQLVMPVSILQSEAIKRGQHIPLPHLPWCQEVLCKSRYRLH
jgi:hypothetical protein